MNILFWFLSSSDADLCPRKSLNPGRYSPFESNRTPGPIKGFSPKLHQGIFENGGMSREEVYEV